ncbi:MAG: hypothetical protein U0940_02660 [Nitrospirota bacterium]|nr:hypothetical protein [Nitrospirota bacterium]
MKRTILIFISLLFLSVWMLGHAEDSAEQRVDSKIKALWSAMVTRLIEKDIEGALGYFSYSTRGRYREQFNLMKERLPEIFAGMQDIEPVYIKGNEAKYRVRIREDGGERTGYIWFWKDIAGEWKIDKF